MTDATRNWAGMIDPDFDAFVRAQGLQGDIVWTRLSGGVSCDTWKAADEARAIVVKRALAKLTVADDWRAPIDRALTEFRWFEAARAVSADLAPEPLAVDAERGFVAMAWLDDKDHRLWKAELLAGRVDVDFARAVGGALGRLHCAFARRPGLAETFATDATFFALRLEAYLLTAGSRNPEVEARLRAVVETTARTKVSLVHGDVSPKNIFIGPNGPVFLDAETAWWGDPAFDLAFCLNHLLLKMTVRTDRAQALAASFAVLTEAYLMAVDWETSEGLEARAAALLPGLTLARVDGKSPVEYLPGEAQRALVRRAALALLRKGPDRLMDVLAGFQAEMALSA